MDDDCKCGNGDDCCRKIGTKDSCSCDCGDDGDDKVRVCAYDLCGKPLKAENKGDFCNWICAKKYARDHRDIDITIDEEDDQ